MADRWVDELVPCGDPECAERGGMAEPESDGELHYYACECGFEFNYEMTRQPEGNCSLGVPEEVRRAVSIDPGQLRQPAGQPVFLGSIGRRME